MKNLKRLVYPYIIWAFILIVIPMLIIVLYAFTKEGNELIFFNFSLSNFARFFQDKVFINVLIKSLGVAFVTTIICILLGYPAAYIISIYIPHINLS